ncbi:MAG: hypothetical protein LBQ40_00640 [Clostridiales bacterium]|jgi:diacylglycerol kinase (ATP)|nr:hypothetical protein [Clostridiales bacterium]
MNCLIINNPVSGHSKTPEQIAEIVAKLGQKYQTVDVETTLPDVTATDIARENLGKYSLYVVLGGDGTLGETLRSIAGKENRPALGYIPCGTVNDFARSNKIPFEYRAAVDVILAGKTVKKGALFMNGTPAASYVLAGMFTSSSYTANSKAKKKVGKLAYYYEILFNDKGRKGEQLEVTLDGDESTTYNSLHTLICFLNNKTVGGLRVTNDEFDDNDTVYALLAKRKKGFFGLLVSLGSMFPVLCKKAENSIIDTKNITIRRVKSATVKAFSPTTWNLDGEKGPVGNAEISYKKDQFELLVP